MIYIDKENNEDFIRLDAKNKSIISQNGKNKATLTSGYVGFTYDNKMLKYALLLKYKLFFTSVLP